MGLKAGYEGQDEVCEAVAPTDAISQPPKLP
jgi:hypothetical protein